MRLYSINRTDKASKMFVDEAVVEISAIKDM